MKGVCLRYCDTDEEAEDVLQTSFMNVFENIAAFKGTGSLEGWIRKIVINTSLTYIRNTKKFKHSIELESVEYMLPSSNRSGENLAVQDY